jgi:predicted DsbA family dithiol-disulfide isomerase
MASRAGMDFSRVSEVLGSDEFAIEVRRDESFAASIGVSGVPFYLIEDKYAISGAQDTMTFVSAMTAVWSKLK